MATGDASEVDGVLTVDGGVVEVGEVIFTKKLGVYLECMIGLEYLLLSWRYELGICNVGRGFFAATSRDHLF